MHPPHSLQNERSDCEYGYFVAHLPEEPVSFDPRPKNPSIQNAVSILTAGSHTHSRYKFQNMKLQPNYLNHIYRLAS